MNETTAHHRRARSVVFPRLFALPRTAIGAAYVVGYVLLDWISFIDPYAPYNITPWNPPTGLSFVLVLIFGRGMIPYLFVAPFMADLIVRHLPLPWMLEFATTAIIGCGYSLALLFLLHPQTRFNSALLSLRDLFLLLVSAAAGGTLVAIGYVGLVTAAGFLPGDDFVLASLRYWVGDVIGIAVIAPFGLMSLTRKKLLKASVETAAQFAAILLALLLVFNFPEEQQLQLFYILFLPIIWMAVRTGLQGVTVGILIVQLGLIVGVHMLASTDFSVTALQTLMLVLAITGLVAGALVTEHRRTNSSCACIRTRLRGLPDSGAWVSWPRRSPMRSINPSWQRERIPGLSARRCASKTATPRLWKLPTRLLRKWSVLPRWSDGCVRLSSQTGKTGRRRRLYAS